MTENNEDTKSPCYGCPSAKPAPPPVQDENTPVLILTGSAVKAVRDNLTDMGLTNFSLRVFVESGGCSGLQYGMSPDTNIEAEDNVLKFEDVTILVDSLSAKYLKGTTIDYKKTLQSSGFIFSNPNASRGCGCKNSFGI